MKKDTPKRTNASSELILYQSGDGKYQILLRPEHDSVWLTLNQLAELYQTSKPNISMHIRNILLENELEEGATVKKNLTVQIENGREVHRNITFYNLDMILESGCETHRVEEMMHNVCNGFGYTDNESYVTVT